MTYPTREPLPHEFMFRFDGDTIHTGYGFLVSRERAITSIEATAIDGAKTPDEVRLLGFRAPGRGRALWVSQDGLVEIHAWTERLRTGAQLPRPQRKP